MYYVEISKEIVKIYNVLCKTIDKSYNVICRSKKWFIRSKSYKNA